MIVPQDIDIEFTRSTLTPVVEVVQGDSGRQLRCRVVDVDIPENSTARIYAVKPSRAEIFNQCDITGQYVSTKLTNQILAEVGDVAFQILISTPSEKITSLAGILHVGESLISESAIESTNEFTALEAALQRTDNIVLKTDVVSNVSNYKDVSSPGKVIDVMLEKDLQSRVWKKIGKNLFQHNYSLTYDARYINATTNADKSIRFYGTYPGSSFVIYTIGSIYLTPGTYIQSGCPAGGGQNTYYQRIVTPDHSKEFSRDYGDGSTFTITTAGTYNIEEMIAQGLAIDKVFYPQICYGDASNPLVYERYAPSNDELNSNLANGLASKLNRNINNIAPVTVTDALTQTITTGVYQCYDGNVNAPGTLGAVIFVTDWGVLSTRFAFTRDGHIWSSVYTPNVTYGTWVKIC